MHISFDLDSTLIPHGNEFESEPRSVFAKLWGVEKIRKGTKGLIDDLQNQGHSIHIHTTSFRSKTKIRKTLRYYGVRVDQIITQSENQKVLKQLNIYASKYPPAFNLDLHIDDSKGVGQEAVKHNFRAIIINPSVENWVEKIVLELKTIQSTQV